MKELPPLTELTLDVGSYLWMVVTAVGFDGIRRIRSQDPVRVLSWCLVAIVVFFGALSVMAYGLLIPLSAIQTTLGK